jgi:hypothetical protein
MGNLYPLRICQPPESNTQCPKDSWEELPVNSSFSLGGGLFPCKLQGQYLGTLVLITRVSHSFGSVWLGKTLDSWSVQLLRELVRILLPMSLRSRAAGLVIGGLLCG